MSARDAESGSSTYKGGSGRAGGLGNGGIGGGMGGGGNHGGGMGGGAGRNGGIGNRTGLTTGNRMYGVAGPNGVTFSGRPGGFAQQPGAFGIRPQPSIMQGPLSGVPRRPGVPVPTALPPRPPAMPQQPLPMPGYMPTYPEAPLPSNYNSMYDFRDDYNDPDSAYGFGYDPSDLGIGPNSPGSTHNQNGSTYNQNNQGNYGGYFQDKKTDFQGNFNGYKGYY